MEQIKILLYVLTSFFGIEDAQIAAENTSVTIDPKNQVIEIVQENLFTLIQTEKDTIPLRKRWDELTKMDKEITSWAMDLDSFPTKNFSLSTDDSSFRSHISLHYTDEKDLRALGIWYNEEKNEFSINNVPRENINTKDGKLDGNYWVFKSDTIFNFTLEPFSQMPEKYQEFKLSIEKLVHRDSKK